MDKSKIDRVVLIQTLTFLSHPISQDPERLNIIGLRSMNHQPNKFDDAFVLLYWYKDDWAWRLIDGTTVPGLYWLENPSVVDGTAILPEGYHEDLWEIGLHHGQYSALVQRRPVQVFRDSNRDQKLDLDPKTLANASGINFHHASATGRSENVDKWSAGCQVVASAADFGDAMTLANKSRDLYGNRFSYSLIAEADIQWGVR